ncbi:MAG: GNAT family N-acetyltransferase [Candidatus Dormibacteraeota bacterium]|uniref:GNAT family N-acetyltransferase n=1 Tax=Candidatus Amunia macphersoniae TaxID=3127014 RepID=A0A934NDT8_9BACT|nr:GNAT family N-acetyltransferase [Candidatus Dormibacteraeota bacterium]
MRVELLAALGPHADAWDALVDGMPLPSPFLRSWWLSTAAGAAPHLALVFAGERLVGGLALECDRHLGVERYRVLGCGRLCPDHLDAVAAPDRPGAVASALRDWLGRSGDRLIDLDGVVSGSMMAAALPGRVRRDRTDVAPYVSLSGGFLASGSAKLRSTVNRTERRLGKVAGSLVVRRVEDTELALGLLRRLHALRWAGASAFLDDFDRFGAVCRAAALRGELAICALFAGEEAIAVVAAFEVAGRISYYQSGRDPAPRWRRSGTLLLARSIDGAAERGLREADLLRGDEQYKLELTSERRQLWRLRCTTGPRSTLALGIDVAAEHGRHLLGRTRRWLRTNLPSRRPPAPQP